MIPNAESDWPAILADFNTRIMHLDAPSVIGEALRFIGGFGIERSSVALLDQENGRFRLLHVTREIESLQEGHSIPFPDTVLSLVVRGDSPVYRPDIRAEERRFPVDELLVKSGIVCDFLIPLVAGRTRLGTLNSGSSSPDGIPSPFRRLLTLMAPSLAQALLNARLFEELRREQETLRQSEVRFALSMEATNDGLWDWDIPSDRAYFSPAYYRMLGYEPDAFAASGRAWAERLHPEDRERAVATAMDCVEGRLERFETEFRLREKGGGWHWILGRGKCVARDASGRALRLVGTHVDIGEKKRAERERQAEERKYQRLLESTNTVPWELDLISGRFTYVGPQIEPLTGYPVAHWSDMDAWAAAIHPEDREQAVAYCRTQSARGRDHDFVYRMFTRDGRTVWIQDVVTVLKGPAGPEKLVGFMHDITAARAAEEERLASQRRYRDLFENMTEAFALHEVILAPDGSVADYRFLDVNPAFERETGLSRERVVGSTQRTLLPDEDPFWRETYGRVALGGAPVHLTHYSSVLRKHYEVYAFSPAPLKFAVLFRDVTAKASLEEQLRQSQKMEAIGTLAGGIAHDFNNILGSIIGFTELTLAALPARSPERENLEEVLVASARAKNLVRKILVFSRRRDRQNLPVDSLRLVSEAMQLLVTVIPKTVTIRQELDPDAGYVLADPTEFHQVVMNLCTNAYQAMAHQEKGTIRVGLSPVTLGSGEATPVPGLAPGKYVRLEVADDGPGMDETTMARIFEPYFTTKPPGKGTGLGLAMVHGIVSGLHGAVAVQSSPGRGATFTIFLPRHLPDEAAVPQAPQSEIPPRTGSIILLDDEPSLVRMGTRMLEGLGHAVTAVTDPLQALRLFQEDPLRFDVIVTDQTMPGLTGAELVRRAKAIRPDIGVVICTGFSELLDEEQARGIGAAAYLLKPYDKRMLGAAVATALEVGNPPAGPPPLSS
jgi:PAS domain S-box-containing protein